ncbi:MAG: DUF389 domain-containing protein [Oscillospiraceae bacterium]|nr:DUF389 domain-containing protein [Oscillospiraceae bacterium]
MHELGQLLKRYFSLHEDSATHEVIHARILSGGQVTGTNLCVLICAIVIASVGLNTGSTAVIIGAMLISPLMGSLLALAYGTVSANKAQFERSAVGFVFQILVSLTVSVVYFALSPVNAPSAELLARTRPTVFDVIVAIAGGFAGIIGNTRHDKANNVIPGVAIATALMPPLCTCGYSIAHGQWRMLFGAAYLFTVNCYFIYLSAAVILSLLSIPKEQDLNEKQWRRLRRKMIRNTVLVALPSLFLTFAMLHDGV